MRNLLFFLMSMIMLCMAQRSFAQQGDSTILKKADSGKVNTVKDTSKPKRKIIADTGAHIIKRKIIKPATDSVKHTLPADTAIVNTVASDSLRAIAINDTTSKDSIKVVTVAPLKPESFVTNKVMAYNKLINVTGAPVYFIQENSVIKGKEFLFYTLCVIVLILGIFKTFYNSYFKNLFRVYFNTSLRQTQLVDQLVQAKLPSFILNIFFAFTTGIYIWLLFNYYHPPRLISNNYLLSFCIITVALLYFGKFCILKFMGWVSDIQNATDNYIFAIFLINKIIGIFLVPVIILLAFINPVITPVVVNISFMILGLFFLSRYIKSYSAIDRKIPLNPFHLIIYIAGAEIIPLLILYKVAVDYLI